MLAGKRLACPAQQLRAAGGAACAQRGVALVWRSRDRDPGGVRRRAAREHDHRLPRRHRRARPAQGRVPGQERHQPDAPADRARAADPQVRSASCCSRSTRAAKPPQLNVWDFADMLLAPFADREGAEALTEETGIDFGDDGGHRGHRRHLRGDRRAREQQDQPQQAAVLHAATTARRSTRDAAVRAARRLPVARQPVRPDVLARATPTGSTRPASTSSRR